MNRFITFILFLVPIFSTTFIAKASTTTPPSPSLAVVAISNLIYDTLYQTNSDFLAQNNLTEGQTKWINANRASELKTIAKQNCKKIQSGPGGSAANTIVGLQNLGLTVGLIGTLAQDELAQLYVQSLHEKNIYYRITHPTDHNLGSGTCTIFITEKQNTLNLTATLNFISDLFKPENEKKKYIERTMLTNLGVSGDIRLSKANINWAANAKCLLIEGYLFEPEATYRSICATAKQAVKNKNIVALTLSADFCVDKHHTKITKFIQQYVTIVFGNESEAQKLTQTNTPLDAAIALRKMGKKGAVTCGPMGAFVFDSTGVYFIASPTVKNVVDTTGAGDQFAAGFLFELLRSNDIIMAGKTGAFCAGEVIQGWGAHPHSSLENIVQSNIIQQIPYKKFNV